MKPNWVAFIVGVVGFIALTVALGHCECWDMVVTDGKYSCETSDCETAPYDDKSVCEDSAYAMTDAHRRRMLEAEEPVFSDPKPDLINKKRKGIRYGEPMPSDIQPCQSYSSDGCVEK